MPEVLFTETRVMSTGLEPPDHQIVYEEGTVHDLTEDRVNKFMKRGAATNDPDKIAEAKKELRAAARKEKKETVTEESLKEPEAKPAASSAKAAESQNQTQENQGTVENQGSVSSSSSLTNVGTTGNVFPPSSGAASSRTSR